MAGCHLWAKIGTIPAERFCFRLKDHRSCCWIFSKPSSSLNREKCSSVGLIEDHSTDRGGAQTCMAVIQRPEFRSRPFHGVWATSSFLHNDPAPTSRDLLRNPVERPAGFLVGNGTFDPEAVEFLRRSMGKRHFGNV